MGEADAALLAALPAMAFHAVLLLSRLGAAVMLLPGLGEAEVPATIRLALAGAMVLALLPALSPSLPPQPAQVSDLLLVVVAEVLCGLWIGLLARVLALALAQAGQVASLMIGLSSPLQGDMVLGAAATALSRLFSLAAATLVLATGLYELPLRALAGSYAVLPPGSGLPAGFAAEEMTRVAAASLAIALRLAAPLVLAGLMLNAALGLAARLAPQSQIFLLAAPVQIVGGLLLLTMLLPRLLAAWGTTMSQGFASLPGS
ncbi:flagellar biosynthetic protein FliR [Roseococcus sp. YIM B11640]|uniref:flagellar biosynthetic protein FliR n=1 Tax=Roseococcus sp. YIM B11640 TaxID=3133973 RepID=UPI003C7CC680